MMKRYLRQLLDLKQEFAAPIAYAGDIFHKWNSSAELINFALRYLPAGFAIPGNHDLPHHNLQELPKSAYSTLCQAKKLDNIPIGDCCFSVEPTDILLHGLHNTQIKHGCDIHYRNIAIVHDYCWKQGHSFPGAPEEKHVKQHFKRLDAAMFNAAFFGDNHRGFVYKNIVNVGGFIRRNIDEVNYKPQVGLLYSDGSVGVHHLDTSEDAWEDFAFEKKESVTDEISALVEVLDALDTETLDFQEAVAEYIEKHNLPSRVCKIILKAIER